MSYQGWQLCARILTATPWPFYVVKESDTKWGVWQQSPDVSPLLKRSGPQFTIAAGARFPFGLPVEDD